MSVVSRLTEPSSAIALTLGRIEAQLPSLPTAIRYFDDYAGITRSIPDSSADVWEITLAGSTRRLDYLRHWEPVRRIYMWWIYWMLHRFEPATVVSRFNALIRDENRLAALLEGLLQPTARAKAFWHTTVIGYGLTAAQLSTVKSLLHFFCDCAVSHWTPAHHAFVRDLPHGISTDDYRSVREGGVFLSFVEEKAIVENFDALCDMIRSDAAHITDRALAENCLLYWIYAHGVRPIQAASCNMADVRVRQAEGGQPIVHLTFRYAKQRANNKRAQDTRTMKRDWTWIMAEWVERRTSGSIEFTPDRATSLFGYSPSEITQAVAELTARITGIRRTPTELRHTAAQRMVDAGASALQLAEFMMHHDIDTGQVYYDASPTQADRINKALGLSPIYSELGEIVRTKSIDKAKLLGLPEDKQIGAAPHGRAVVGIGACNLGQSLCAKNPGLSCYECAKFMPLNEPEIHVEAREAIAATVREFVDAAKFDETNPAFMQLRRTLELIDDVIEQMSPENKGVA